MKYRFEEGIQTAEVAPSSSLVWDAEGACSVFERVKRDGYLWLSQCFSTGKKLTV